MMGRGDRRQFSDAKSSVAATSLSDIVCGFQMLPYRAETTSDPVGARGSERRVNSVEATD